MQTSDCLEIAASAVSAQADRAATSLVLDSDDARVVVFRIDAGQAVPLHSSDSTVILTAMSGSGFISGPGSEVPVRPGTIATYQPGELHAMRADKETLIVIATIAPRPGTIRPAPAA